MSSEELDNASRPSRAWVGGIGLAVVFLMAVTPYQSYDVWHHVRCGWYAWNYGPGGVEPFSCTGQKLQLPWLQHEWLSQIMLYLSHERLGPSGTVLVKAAVLALGFGLLALACRARGAGWDATATAVVLAALAGAPRFFVRPEIFSFVLLAALLWALERALAGRTRALWLMPPAFALWANLHGVYVAGWAVLGLAALGIVIQRKARWRLEQLPDPKVESGLALTLVGCVVGVCANPSGVKLLGIALHLSGSPVVGETIEEWMAPEIGALVSVHALFVPVLVLSCALGRRRLRLADWLIVLSFTGLALSARRHIPILAFVTCPIVADQLGAVFDRARPGPKVWARVRPFVAPSGCVLMLLLARGPRLSGLKLGVESGLYPVLAADFLESEDLRGNLFNGYVDGNYLIWRCYPRNLVFIDGRIETYGEEVLRLYYEASNAMQPGEAVTRFGTPYESEGWRRILDRFEVKICLVRRSRGNARQGAGPGGVGSVTHPLADALWLDDEWKLLFWDDERLLFVRSELVGGRYVYHTRPGPLALGVTDADDVWMEALADTQHRLALGPQFDCFLARTRMADLLRQRGRFRESLPHLERASELRPWDGAAAYNFGACLLTVGEAEQAFQYFLRAVKLGMPAAEKAWNGLASSALALGRNEDALGYARRAIKTRPGYVLGHLCLSVALERAGDARSALAAAEEARRLAPGNVAARERVKALKRGGN